MKKRIALLLVLIVFAASSFGCAAAVVGMAVGSGLQTIANAGTHFSSFPSNSCEKCHAVIQQNPGLRETFHCSR